MVEADFEALEYLLLGYLLTGIVTNTDPGQNILFKHIYSS